MNLFETVEYKAFLQTTRAAWARVAVHRPIRETTMPAPFKTPTFISDRNFLVAADYELIARLVDANYDELIYIVKAINAHQRLLDCVKELRDYVKSATLEGDEPPTAEADALIEELNS